MNTESVIEFLVIYSAHLYESSNHLLINAQFNLGNNKFLARSNDSN